MARWSYTLLHKVPENYSMISFIWWQVLAYIVDQNDRHTTSFAILTRKFRQVYISQSILLLVISPKSNKMLSYRRETALQGVL